jgi:carbon storage regulator
MLVLSRKIGQSIVIGDGIEITIVELRGDQVRLGIDAPREVPVNRKEILERMRAEPAACPPVSAPRDNVLDVADHTAEISLSPVNDGMADGVGTSSQRRTPVSVGLDVGNVTTLP